MSLTKWRTAIHTTCRLHFAFNGGMLFIIAALDGVEFFPVEDTFGGVTVGLFVTLVVDETTEFFDGLICSIATLDSVTLHH